MPTDAVMNDVTKLAAIKSTAKCAWTLSGNSRLSRDSKPAAGSDGQVFCELSGGLEAHQIGRQDRFEGGFLDAETGKGPPVLLRLV